MLTDTVRRRQNRGAVVALLVLLAGLLMVPWVPGAALPEIAHDILSQREADAVGIGRARGFLVVVEELYLGWGWWLTAVPAILATVAVLRRQRTFAWASAGLLACAVLWLIVAYFHLALVQQPQFGPYLSMLAGAVLVGLLVAVARPDAPTSR